MVETLARLLEGPAAASRFHCAALVAARTWALLAALVSHAPSAYLTPALLAACRRLVGQVCTILVPMRVWRTEASTH